jgi:salicylate hydroxylase
MAIEDGAVLGHLLGSLAQDEKELSGSTSEHVSSLLQVYEKLRKMRTTTNVKGAEANRYMYHLEDGDEQRQRDADLRSHDWTRPTRWRWVNRTAQDELLGHDVMAESDEEYKVWKSGRIQEMRGQDEGISMAL